MRLHGSTDKIRPPTRPTVGSSSGATRRASQAGSTTQSASVNAIQCPRAAAMPALRAADTPRRVSRSTRTWPAYRCRIAAVPSVESLSTTTISRRSRGQSSRSREARHASMVASPFRTATTTETRGPGATPVMRPPAACSAAPRCRPSALQVPSESSNRTSQLATSSRSTPSSRHGGGGGSGATGRTSTQG